GRRTTPRALLVAAAADVESSARRKETVERRGQLSARQPVLGIRPGVQPLPFSAGAPSAKQKFALVARGAEFAEAEQLIAAPGSCAARLANCLCHFYRFATEPQGHRGRR